MVGVCVYVDGGMGHFIPARTIQNELEKMGHEAHLEEFFNLLEIEWIGKLNKWIPLIGQIANTIMDIWDHNKQEEARHKLEEMKREIRASFNEIACDLENDGRAFVNNEFGKSMDKLINKHIEELSKFDKLRDNNNENCSELRKCAKEIAALVKELQG